MTSDRTTLKGSRDLLYALDPSSAVGDSPPCETTMIRDAELYRRLVEQERWRALQEMSPEESIAIGEALLTSAILALARLPRRRRPRCLAVALGITKTFQPSAE